MTATAQDLAMLEELCDLLKNTSLCGLGSRRPIRCSAPCAILPTNTRRILRTRTVRRASAAQPAGGDAMSPATNGQDAEDRRPGCQRAPGRNHPRRCPREQYLYSAPVRDWTASPTSALAACAWWKSRAQNKLLPACVTAVEEGMEVTTTSERLNSYRRMILELLFTERNHVCSVCVSNGHCELQTLAQKLGITHVHFPYRYPKRPGGRLARPLRRRSQPLHPLHPLRARVR